MTSFHLAAALLVVAVIAILLPPLLRAPEPSAGATSAKRIWPFSATSSPNSSASATTARSPKPISSRRNELQRRLLDEVRSRTAASAPPDTGRAAQDRPGPAHRPAAGCRCGYALLGNPRALDPLQRQARIAPEQIEGWSTAWSRSSKNPDDSKGWVMLARSYKVLERFPEAAEAYSRAATLVDQDPALLADYADVLSRSNGGKLQGKPTELVERALKIDPDEPQALLLAGAAASDRQQFAAAAEYWSRCLATRTRLRGSQGPRRRHRQGARDRRHRPRPRRQPASQRRRRAPSVAK
jgi:cytochrome c-type biogenesis protein CcmH